MNVRESANVTDTDDEKYPQYQHIFQIPTRANASMRKRLHKNVPPPTISQTMPTMGDDNNDKHLMMALMTHSPNPLRIKKKN